MQNTQLLEEIQEMLKEKEKPLTFEEARAFLQISKSSLYKLVHRKEIEYFKPSGGKLYFDKQVLLEYMRRGRVKSAAQIDEEATNHIMYK
jgi:excisionase family DNA binding protein